MGKNIWIMNHYATGMFDEKGGRHYNFAKYLTAKGYSPTIFCANVYHNSDKVLDLKGKAYSENCDENTKIVYVKTTPYTGNGISRVKNMAFFAKNLMQVAKQYIKSGAENPDVILASSVHPLTCVAGVFIAKRLKVPCIVEIRDLWPESIVAYSSRFTKTHPLIKLLYMLEKWIYKKSDALIFTMQGGADYIKDMGWDKDIDLSKVHHINNGVDLETFDYNKDNFITEDIDLENNDIFKVVYTGSIRRVNNLGILLDAAKLITEPKIKLLIWGGGDELEALKQRVIDENITNVVFKGSVDKKYVPYILSRADVNLSHYSYSEINRYGTSRNKMFEYLASNKSVISTEWDKYELIKKHFCGVSMQCDNAEEIASLINQMYNTDDTTKKIMASNARETAKEYDFKVLTDKLIDIINQLP